MPYETDNHRNSFRFSGYPEDQKIRTGQRKKGIKTTAQNQKEAESERSRIRKGSEKRIMKNRFRKNYEKQNQKNKL